MKKRILTLLMAAALLVPAPALAAEPVAEEAPERAEISLPEAETPEAPASDPETPDSGAEAPAPEDEAGAESAGEAGEESAPVQLLADAQTEVHASTAAELMEYLKDGASNLLIILDANKDYEIYSWYTNTSTGKTFKVGFSVKNLSNVTIRGGQKTQILTPEDCGGSPVMTFTNCTGVTLDTLSMGHKSIACSEPVLVLDGSTGVEIQNCDLWGCGYYGIGCIGSSIHAANTVIRDCEGYILHFSGGTAAFDRCIFRDNCELRAYDNMPIESVALQGAPDRAVFNSCQFLRNKNTYKLEAASSSRYTFSSCTETDNGWNSTEEITLSVGDSATLTLVGSAATITGTGAIANVPFDVGRQITTITVDSGITELGTSCMGGLTGLQEISLPDTLTKIGGYAFNGDSNLRRITIPGGVTVLGDRVFQGCSLLREVILPNSLTEIGPYAFGGCGLLSSITLPASLRTVGQGAFSDCSSLKRIVFPEGVQTIDGYVCDDCTGLRDLTLPTTLTSLGNSAFLGCTNLETLTLPATVALSASAFNKSYDKLTRVILTGSGPMAAKASYPTPWSTITCHFTVEIREGVTSVGDSVFSNCAALTAVSLPSSVETIGSYAFSGCTGLSGVNLPGGLTSIGTYAFSSCAGLTELALPGGLTSIGANAFAYCTGLTKLNIPDSVSTVGSSAFSKCTGLRSVSIPMAALYGESGTNQAFKECTGITRVKLRGTGDMRSMYGGNYNRGTPWRETKSPVTVELAEGITGIGECAFWASPSLASVVIPKTVTHIDKQAFCESGLEALTLPSSVTSIGEEAFSKSKIVRITIPASVTGVGKYAFNGCSRPTVYYGGTEAQWEAALNGQPLANGALVTVLYETSEAGYMTARLGEIVKPEATLAEVKTGLAALNAGSLSDALLLPENREKFAAVEDAVAVQTAEGAGLAFDPGGVSITGAKVNFPDADAVTLMLAAPEVPDYQIPAASGTELRFSAKLVDGSGAVLDSDGGAIPMAVTLTIPGRDLLPESVRVWHLHGGAGAAPEELLHLRAEPAEGGLRLTFTLTGFSDLIVTCDTGFSLTRNGSTVSVSDEKGTLDGCTTVYAAGYDSGGRLTGLTEGKLSGTRITFPQALEAGDVLFFLNGDSKPVREKAPVT